MVLFKNEERSYPIRGVPDNVEGVTYRTSPKAWTDSKTFPLFFQEPRSYQSDPQGRKKYLFVDNFSGHNLIPQLEQTLANVSTKLLYFPPNATHLIQPADSFIISNLKEKWRKCWDFKMQNMIENNEISNSGKISNPGKSYYLKLTATVVKEFNENPEKSYQAMKLCGLNTDVDGVWRTTQLKKELQDIIIKYSFDFDCGY